MIVPELPDYLTSLGGGEYKGLIIALFTVTAGLSRPFSGKLADTIGRIPVMIIGAVVCFVVGILYPMFNTVWAFFLLRLLHGFSTGFKPTGTAAYIADIVPANRRGEAMGIGGIFGSAGMALGPYFGPKIAQAYSIEWMFYTSSIIAILSVLILIGMKESLPNKIKFNTGLLRIRKDEIIEARVFSPSIVFILTAFSFGAVLTLIPDLTMSVGFSPENKGIFFTVFVVASLFIRFLAGKASDKFGRVIVLKIAALSIAIADIVLAYAHDKTMLIIGGILFGIAVGMNTPTLYAWTVDLAIDKFRGKALATMYIALEIGIGAGAFFGGLIYSNEMTNMRNAFFTCAALSLLALLYLNFGIGPINKFLSKRISDENS
jgi:MFS family permease